MKFQFFLAKSSSLSYKKKLRLLKSLITKNLSNTVKVFFFAVTLFNLPSLNMFASPSEETPPEYLDDFNMNKQVPVGFSYFDNNQSDSPPIFTTNMELFELTEREKMLLKSVGSKDTDKGWRVPLGENLIKACFCMQIGHDEFFSLCTAPDFPNLVVSVRTDAPAFIHDFFNENVRDSNAQSPWFKEIEQKGYTSNTAATLPLLHYKIAAAASLKMSQSNPTELQSLSPFYLSPDEQKLLWNLDKLSLYFMVLGPDLMSICEALQKSSSEVRLALTKWEPVPTYDALIIVRNQISKNSLNEREESFLKPFSDILNRLLQTY